MRTLGVCLALSLSLTATADASNCPAQASQQIEIYPTAEVLPANLLRMYVYFPRPMGIEEGLGNVHLLNDKGVAIEGAFLSNRIDLWSADRQRLTVLFDPGRVKTGLAAHDQLGRALTVDQSYTLLVSGDAMDAEGCAIGADARHRFSVEAPDTKAPAPSQWTVTPPAASTRQALEIDLGSPHDHVSLAYRIRVLDSDGAILPGKISLGAGEKTWNYVPRAPWLSASYSVVIASNLEDLAGNRPGRPFDRSAGQGQNDWTNHLRFAPIEP